MKISIDQDYFESLVLIKRSFRKVATLWGLDEEDIQNPNAGDVVVDHIKQLQQAQLLVKGLKMKLNENTRVENYNQYSSTVDTPPPALPENSVD